MCSNDIYDEIIPYDPEVHPRGNNSSCVTKKKYPYGRVRSTEDAVRKAMWVHGSDRYDYSKSVFVNKLTPMTIICPEHGAFEQAPSTHLAGSGCKLCVLKRHQDRRTDSLIDKFEIVHGSKYDYGMIDLESLESAKTKVPIYCKEHDHVFYMTPDVHLRGCGCPKCANRYRRTPSEWKEEIEQIFSDQPWLDFSESEFKRGKDIVSFYCKKHNIVIKHSAADLLDGSGCHECYSEKMLEQRRLERVDQIKREILDHSRFVYDMDGLVDKNVPMWITCIEHQVSFKIAPYYHNRTNSKGCPICQSHHIKEMFTRDTDWFVENSKEMHGEDTFDYSKAEYTKSTEPVTLICNKDGWEFQITPHSHFTKGAGCPKCSGKVRWTTETWVKYASKERGDEGFDYSMVDYKGAFSPVTIRCSNGHEFTQTPDNHMNGKKGCPYCTTPNRYYGTYYEEFTMGVVYVMRFSSEQEEFAKIGISKNISTRFSGRDYRNFDITEEYISDVMCIGDALEIEQYVLSKLRSEGKCYSPIVESFAGRTECFNSEYIENTIDMIKEYKEE